MVHRIRFLFGIDFPFKKGGTTRFMLADEVHLNFGKKVVFNTFNQNRIILGIKQKMTKNQKS